jgi:hypothetical protein
VFGIALGRSVLAFGILRPIERKSTADEPISQIGATYHADSDDLARVYRFDLAQDSEMISPTIPI